MTDTQPTEANSGVGRRALLGWAAALASATALAPLAPLDALAARAAAEERDTRRPHSPDYGPLVPVHDHTTGLPLLLLPRGFEYLSYGWTGDLMDDGVATPGLHDGMAAFRSGRNGRVHLVRNHEVGGFRGKFTDPAYDPDAGGGTSTLVFDPDDENSSTAAPACPALFATVPAGRRRGAPG